jgi:hypothetical protein
MSDTFYGESYREAARRQFRLSVAVVVLMAIGAFAAGFVSPIGTAHNARNVDDTGVFFGRLVATVDQ